MDEATAAIKGAASDSLTSQACSWRFPGRGGHQPSIVVVVDGGAGVIHVTDFGNAAVS